MKRAPLPTVTPRGRTCPKCKGTGVFIDHRMQPIPDERKRKIVATKALKRKNNILSSNKSEPSSNRPLITP